MIKLYHLMDGKKVVVDLFIDWKEAERALDEFNRRNPDRTAYISSDVGGKLKIRNKDCPINIFGLYGDSK